MFAIDLRKVCFIAVKARGFDARLEGADPDSDPEPGPGAADEDVGELLERYADDPAYDELKDAIDALNEDEQIDLVALTWLGRGDGGKADWDALRDQARDARSDHTADYLLGIPLLADYLEEGLAELGRSCIEDELERL
jgi:hypothetical protein